MSLTGLDGVGFCNAWSGACCGAWSGIPNRSLITAPLECRAFLIYFDLRILVHETRFSKFGAAAPQNALVHPDLSQYLADFGQMQS